MTRMCSYYILVCIVTRYGLDGPGIESRWRRSFPHRSRPAVGSNQPLIPNGYWVFPKGKTAEAWRLPPTTYDAYVKRMIALLLLLSLWAFVAFSRVTFTITFTIYKKQFDNVSCNRVLYKRLLRKILIKVD